jgi:PAS domain S-box-containing protein
VNATLRDTLLTPLLERAAVAVCILDPQGRFIYVNQRLADVNGASVEQHLGRTLHEVIPHIADEVAAHHATVIETGEPIRDLQVRGTTPGMPDRTWQVSYLPLEMDGERVVGALMLDVSERERAVAEAERRVRQHAAVADLGQRALSGLSIDELMQAACDVVRHELDADIAVVVEFDHDAERLMARWASGGSAPALAASGGDIGRLGEPGLAWLSSGLILSADIVTEPRFDTPPGIRALGARAAISTPIALAHGPYGVLGCFSLQTDHFDEDDAGFVRAVANVLGHALVREEQGRELSEMSEQRGRLVAQALDAGEREQRQVSDVLHDDVLQHLLFARQELGSADVDELAIGRARASVEEAAALLRRVVAGLHPVTLAHAGLAAALEQLAGEHRVRAGLETEVRVESEAEGLHDRLVVSLVRELLANVAKHADARRAIVEVCLGEGVLRVVVADDGRGMADGAIESALARGNIGLAAARERVEALGGMTQVCSGIEGGGTSVEIRLPI